jgi:trans-aconitate 2-methyltransferase
VVALDGSASMLERARSRLGRFGERVTFVHADLGRPLPVEEPVDAILSTATFHWVPDHDALFRNLAAIVRAEGHLGAQCGGAGTSAPS